jgi:DNA-directed RNA polymerase specialized sigma subunit
VPPLALAADESLEPEDRVLIRRAFGMLGTLERRVIAGIYFVGLTQLQLAAALQLTPKRISRIHLRALANMRRAWSSAQVS